MRGLVVTLAVLILVVIGGYWWASAPEPQATEGTASSSVRIAAASDLRFALDDLVAAFGRRRPDVAVQVTYGSSGNFFAQLSNHAPFDLFLSADMEYPRRLTETGLAESDTLFRYAVGHVVAWVPRTSTLDVASLGAKAFLDPSVRKIAVANPKYAPYGRAAVAALKSIGIYEQIRDKLVYGETVAQAAQFTQSRAADVGIIGRSLALSPRLKEQGRYWDIPADAYPRMDQGGVILNWAESRPAAEGFRDFLLSADGQEVLRRFGFSPPEE